MKLENSSSLRLAAKLIADLSDDDASAIVTLVNGTTVELKNGLVVGNDYLAMDNEVSVPAPVPIVRRIIPFSSILEIEIIL